jgi:hypothetical protein
LSSIDSGIGPATMKTSKNWRGIGRVAAVAALGLTAACSAAPRPVAMQPGQGIEVLMPPDEYIHPFHGRTVVMNLPHKAGNPMLSLSSHANGTCAIWLPKVGDPGISEALYECLAVIEVANCNGATDINTPAVKARASVAEQARYGRPCSQGRWDWAYNAVRATLVASDAARPVEAAF